MYKYIVDSISKLDSKFKFILFLSLGVAIASLPTTIAIILVNVDGVSYKKNDTEIKLSGKAQQVHKIANETEYSTKALSVKLSNLQQQIQELQYAKKDSKEFIIEAKEVTKSFNDLIPTANQAFEDTEELTELVESTIAQENRDTRK